MSKNVDIGIHLIFEAEFYLQDIDLLTGDTIRECAADLADHLGDVAKLADILGRDGWNLEVKKCNLVGTHPDVKTAEDAMNRLIGLGVWGDGDLIDVAEWGEQGNRLSPLL